MLQNKTDAHLIGVRALMIFVFDSYRRFKRVKKPAFFSFGSLFVRVIFVSFFESPPKPKELKIELDLRTGVGGDIVSPRGLHSTDEEL